MNQGPRVQILGMLLNFNFESWLCSYPRLNSILDRGTFFKFPSGRMVRSLGGWARPAIGDAMLYWWPEAGLQLDRVARLATRTPFTIGSQAHIDRYPVTGVPSRPSRARLTRRSTPPRTTFAAARACTCGPSPSKRTTISVRPGRVQEA